MTGTRSLPRKTSKRRILGILASLLFFLVASWAEGQLFMPGADRSAWIRIEQLAEFVKNGKLSQESLDLYELSLEKRGADRIQALQVLLDAISVPEESPPEGLVRTLTFEKAHLQKKMNDPAAAKHTIEEWLANNPEEPEEIGLRAWILGILIRSGKKLGLTAQERQRQADLVVAPVARKYPDNDLQALQARIRHASGRRQFAADAASEWRLSVAASPLTVEARKLQGHRIVLENAVVTERDLTALRSTLKGMLDPETSLDPVGFTSPLAENPVANLLAGVEHEIDRTVHLREYTKKQIEILSKVVSEQDAEAALDRASDETGEPVDAH